MARADAMDGRRSGIARDSNFILENGFSYFELLVSFCLFAALVSSFGFVRCRWYVVVVVVVVVVVPFSKSLLLQVYCSISVECQINLCGN